MAQVVQHGVAQAYLAQGGFGVVADGVGAVGQWPAGAYAVPGALVHGHGVGPAVFAVGHRQGGVQAAGQLDGAYGGA